MDAPTRQTSAMESNSGGTQSRSPSAKWKTITIGLAVRLAGLLLIWLGDGHSDFLHKAVVLVGVVLSVGGIAVLRYLLITGLFKKK